MLDYSEATKGEMTTQGWESDVVGHFNSPLNAGWLKRRSKFLQFERSKGKELTYAEQKYRSDPVVFVGSLRTNWESCTQGLVPNSSLTIQIKFTDPDFAVWSQKPTDGSEAIQYKLEVAKCELYVGVAQLNMPINNHLQSALNHGPAVYYYRELRCQTFPILTGTSTYDSPDLRSPNQATIKIYIALVKRTAFFGNQHENP